MGSARLVKGDALNPQDVANAWTKAAEGENSRVDFVIFSIGQLYFYSSTLSSF